MDALLNDLRYTARALRRSPGFVLAAVATLALGIGATTTVFSLLNAFLLRPLPFPAPERLVAVTEDDLRRNARDVSSSVPDYLDWRAGLTKLEELGAVHRRALTVRVDGDAERIGGAALTASMFRVLGARPAAGRVFTDEEDVAGAGKVVVVGEAFWRDRLGGGPDALGRVIQVNGEPHTIVGVMPASFRFPYLEEMWVPLAPGAAAARGERFLTVIGRLRAGATAADAQAELAPIAQRLVRTYPENDGRVARVAGLQAATVQSVRPVMLILLCAVGFVLMIACANVAGLMLARSAERAREIAIRSALGAGRSRIARQLLTETLVLASIGGACGTLVAAAGLRLVLAAVPVPLPYWLAFTIDGRVLALTLAATAASAVVLGLAPALQSARVDLQEVLRERGRGATAGRKGARLRSALVVAETAAAVLLLVGGLLMMRSFLAMRRVEPGFVRSGVVAMQLELPAADYPDDARIASTQDRLLERVRALPGVSHASLTGAFPVDGDPITSNFSIRGIGEIRSEAAYNLQVAPGWFETMGVSIVRGRAFDARDRAGAAPVAIVNETLAARHFPGQDPIGRQIRIGGAGGDDADYATIVGVARDIHQRDVNQREIGSDIYRPLAQAQQRGVALAVRSSADAATLVAAVRRELAALDPHVPLYNVKTVEQVLDEATWDARLNTALLAVFAAAALLLASIGLYGVIAYTVARRTHEIGVRVALGARPADVLRLVVGGGMRLAAIGLALGLAGALALANLLGGILFGVQPRDPLTYATVAIALGLVALAASWLPARRALAVQPVAALRAE
jgi:putative ABC transport system permease protein